MNTWQVSQGWRVGDAITMMVPRRDLWSRFLRLIGWGERLEKKTFVCTHTTTADH